MGEVLSLFVSKICKNWVAGMLPHYTTVQRCLHDGDTLTHDKNDAPHCAVNISHYSNCLITKTSFAPKLWTIMSYR